MKNIRKKIGIAALCILTGLGGYGAGKATSKVDKVTFQQEGGPGNISSSGFKAIKLHRPFGKDEIFLQLNGSSYWEWKSCWGEYSPMEEYLNRSYGHIRNGTVVEDRQADINRLFSSQDE